ncbi:MAG: protein translocase subunit SecD [Gammaproteobacteria bacterium]|nr:protein translocase subunit SecD [Gammaproteobacteria bacterium]
MPDNSVFGQNLFGTRTPTDQPYRYSLWRYILALLILVLGVLYALPNLYPPDHAIQIGIDNSTASLGQKSASQLTNLLEDAGIPVKMATVIEKGTATEEDRRIQIHLESESDQIRAKDLLETRLNPVGMERQFIIALNLAPTTPNWLRDIGSKPMTLGLDLAGGIHFVLQVDMQSALDKQLTDEVEKATSQLRDANIRYLPGDEFIVDGAVQIGFVDASRRDDAMIELTETYGPPYYLLEEMEIQGAPGVQITLTEERLREIEDAAIEQNLTGLRNRVNELGVAEPLVQRLGSSRIVIELPGVQDSSEAKRILDKFATLEFRLEANSNDRPSQIEVMPYEGIDVRLLKEVIVSGDHVVNAQQGRDPETSAPQVNMEFDGIGGQLINDATAPNIGRRMGIIFIEQRPVVVTDYVDGERVESTKIETTRRVISVATIQGALSYRSRITGITVREARELALLLRAGALAAPMYFVEERTIGASLGEENIDRGMLAVVVGLVLVLVFMVSYYKIFGLIADICLTMNMIVLVALLSALGATLTLPGIAGIVLTVGMAVDANVLIFSRIREELKRSAPAVAIKNGYDRAFVTILDANITTLFVALILLAIGSGPVAGFAVTLSIGIVTSMFTSIFVSRGLVHLVYGNRAVRKVWI